MLAKRFECIGVLMNDKIAKMNIKTRYALSFALSVQLTLSLSPLSAFADGDGVSNNTLPLAQPSPSQMVQRVWSSLNIRRFAKKKETLSTAEVSADKKAIAQVDKSQDAKNETKESASSPVSVTSTGQMVFPAANTEKLPEENTNQLERIDASATNAAKASPDADAAKTKAAEAAPAPVAQPDSSAGAASQPLAVKEEVPASPEKTAGSLQGEVNDTAGNASTTASSAPSAAAAVKGPISIAANLISLPPGSVLAKVQGESDAVIIDNDEVQEVEETLKEEILATDDGKTHAKAGARFPVVLASQVNSKTAKKGDPIKAKLKYDLKIGNRLIAKKGAVVNGHVNYVLRARTIMHSLLSPERWYRNSGCIGLTFDEIINEKGEHLPLNAQPSRQARIVKNKGEGRELGVNQYGQVTGPWAQQIRYKAIRIGLNAALAPAGVFSFGAMPVALGVLGAANPSFAFAKPVGLNVRHRRIKGFAWGFLSGIPGSWLIEDTTVKGQEAIVKPGDEFYAELVQEFTGEPASDAQLMPGAATKLHGEVLSDTKKGKKKKN